MYFEPGGAACRTRLIGAKPVKYVALDFMEIRGSVEHLTDVRATPQLTS
jgi:hypothetical protein